MGREPATDRDRKRRLVAEHARVRRSIEARRIPVVIGCAQPLQYERSPLLADHLASHHQLDSIEPPIHSASAADIDDVLKERRVSEEDHLIELRSQLSHDPKYLFTVITGSDSRDRVALGGKVPAAACRVHPTD